MAFTWGKSENKLRKVKKLKKVRGRFVDVAGYFRWRVVGLQNDDGCALPPTSVTVPPGSRKRMEVIGSRAPGDPVGRGPPGERKSRNTASNYL